MRPFEGALILGAIALGLALASGALPSMVARDASRYTTLGSVVTEDHRTDYYGAVGHSASGLWCMRSFDTHHPGRHLVGAEQRFVESFEVKRLEHSLANAPRGEVLAIARGWPIRWLTVYSSDVFVSRARFTPSIKAASQSGATDGFRVSVGRLLACSALLMACLWALCVTCSGVLRFGRRLLAQEVEQPICTGCGYELTGIGSRACPECGRPQRG